MPFISINTRELPLHIVYCGPPSSGKSSTLRQLHERCDPVTRGKLLAAPPEQGGALQLDMLARNLNVRGFTVRLHMRTLPGKVEESSWSAQLRKHVDGVVFVVDSQQARMEANLDSFEAVMTHIAESGADPHKLPFVFQYNKRDLPDAATAAELDTLLLPERAPRFESVAARGEGLFAPLKACVRQVLAQWR